MAFSSKNKNKDTGRCLTEQFKLTCAFVVQNYDVKMVFFFMLLTCFISLGLNAKCLK